MVLQKKVTVWEEYEVPEECEAEVTYLLHKGEEDKAFELLFDHNCEYGIIYETMEDINPGWSTPTLELRDHSDNIIYSNNLDYSFETSTNSNKIFTMVLKNSDICPCSGNESTCTKCPCTNFRKDKKCQCNLYVKING
jgi:hypothetical protein